MEYAKFIKAHPLPEMTEEQTAEANRIYANRKERRYWSSYYNHMYTADIIDGVLTVTVYEREKGKTDAAYRHLYDKTSYATQRICDGKKLTGSIQTYLSMWYPDPLDRRTKQALAEYFPDIYLPDITALRDREEKIMRGKLLKRHQKIKDRIDERMACIPDPPEGFENWIANTLLIEHRYFFYKYQRSKMQTGRCSRCGDIFEAKVRHGDKLQCPGCGSHLTARSVGKLSKYGFSKWHTAVLAQTVADTDGKTAIVERTFNIKFQAEDYSDPIIIPPKTEHTKYEYSRVFFTPGKLEPKNDKRNNYEYFKGKFLSEDEHRWCERQNLNGAVRYRDGLIYPENIAEITGRIDKLKNVDTEVIARNICSDLYNLVKYAVSRPVAENLARSGRYELLQAVMSQHSYEHGDLFKLLDFRQASPCKCLGIDRPTYERLGDISEKDFILYRSLKDLGADMQTFERYRAINMGSCTVSFSSFVRKKKMPLVRFAGYLEKQCKLLKLPGNEVFGIYEDYRSMAVELKMPLTDSVIYPKNVIKEHDAVMKLKHDRKYSKQNKLLKKRGELLHTLDYSDKKYLIKAFDSVDDFINESARLNHCVKTYIDRCAEGSTNIYGIRRTEAPDEPYFTLTLDNTAGVTQNLGKNNCQPTAEVKAFVKKWERTVIKKHKEEFIKAAEPKKARNTA